MRLSSTIPYYEIVSCRRFRYVGHTARTCLRQVASRLSEYYHAPAGHILAAVVAYTSTTAVAPELRTAKRSPARPLM